MVSREMGPSKTYSIEWVCVLACSYKDLKLLFVSFSEVEIEKEKNFWIDSPMAISLVFMTSMFIKAAIREGLNPCDY